MVELLPNMVLSEIRPDDDAKDGAKPKEWVVLHVDPYDLDDPAEDAGAYVIERHARQAVPHWRRLHDLSGSISDGLLELSRKPLLSSAMFAASAPVKRSEDLNSGDEQTVITPKDESTRKKTLEFRQGVLAHVRELCPGLDLYNEVARGKAINTVANEFGLAAKTVRRWMTRWWQAGCRDAALLTRYSECGRRGEERVSKVRPSNPNEAKPTGWLGRKPRWRAPGVVIDHAHLPRMHVAWKTMKDEGWSRAQAYSWMLGQFYSDELELDADGCPRLKRDAKAPTRRQFDYWLKKYLTDGQIKGLTGLNRPGRRRLSKQYKTQRRKKARTGVAGPGEVYEIDATIIDLYVVASTDRGKVIGRPVLYVIIDVWSGMVVGAYITVENASWSAAMGAIDAILEDKVALCTRYGVYATAAMWPNSALPQSFQADNAEVKSRLAERLLKATGLRIAHHPAYWPEWKPFVESSFRLINAAFGDYVDGYVDINRERGEADYRGDAVMTVEEVFGMVLSRLVEYNNDENTAYIMPPDMVAEKVLPVPSAMWAWGIRRRSGLQRHFDRDFVRFALMPQARGVITHNGVLFKGLLYDSEALSASGIYAKAGDARIPVTVTYDPRCLDNIYIHEPNAPKGSDGYAVVELTEDYSFARGLSLQELSAYNDDIKALRAAAKRRSDGVAAVQAVRNFNAVKEARKATALAGANGLTARERTSNMRTERQAERKRRAQEASFISSGTAAPRAISTTPDTAQVVDELDIDQVAARHAA